MINRLLKDELRKKYVSFCTNKKNDNKVTRDMVIDWIQDIWYNSKAINKDLIYKSFRTCGLTNKLDGSENHLFKGFDLLQQKIVIDEYKDINGKTVEDTIDENDLLDENE